MNLASEDDNIETAIPPMGGIHKCRVGCDLFVSASATVESQSNFNLQVSLV